MLHDVQPCPAVSSRSTLLPDTHARTEPSYGWTLWIWSTFCWYTLELHDGVPHEAIIARATEGPCDLIIMGTHGRTGWRHMFMGSTAERVLREAPCPVLTIRQPQDDSNT
ncbi:MAG: universal stress protein [Myxococcota bacterium]